MVVGIFRGMCSPLLDAKELILEVFQLGICAIPVFFKIPGVHSFDLGSRTEGEGHIRRDNSETER
jgi:hypothetical protein